MAQTSILGRIGQLVRANVNSILDGAEDPEKMLDQLIRDFTNNIAEAEEAVAQTVGNLRLIEDDAREAREAAREWGDKANAASRRADQLRGEGNTAEADRFDGLAKIAIGRQLSLEEQVRTFDIQIAQQTELTDKLKDGLNKLRVKREELVQKRDELVSRAKMAQAQIPGPAGRARRVGHGSDERAQPLRRADPPPGGDGPGNGRGRSLIDGGAVRRPRGHRPRARNRSSPRRAQGRRGRLRKLGQLATTGPGHARAPAHRGSSGLGVRVAISDAAGDHRARVGGPSRARRLVPGTRPVPDAQVHQRTAGRRFRACPAPRAARRACVRRDRGQAVRRVHRRAKMRSVGEPRARRGSDMGTAASGVRIRGRSRGRSARSKASSSRARSIPPARAHSRPGPDGFAHVILRLTDTDGGVGYGEAVPFRGRWPPSPPSRHG